MLIDHTHLHNLDKLVVGESMNGFVEQVLAVVQRVILVDLDDTRLSGCDREHTSFTVLLTEVLAAVSDRATTA